MRTLIAVVLGALILVAPAIPGSALVAVHLLAGSGRWARMPPFDMGLPLLTAAAIVINRLAVYDKRKDVEMVRSSQSIRFVAFSLAFVVALLLSLWHSGAPEYGLNKAARLSLLELAPLAAIVAIPLSRREIHRMAFTLLAGTTAISCVALGLELIGRQTSVRFSLLGTSPLALGSAAAIGAAIAFASLLEAGRSVLLRVAYLGAMAVNAGACIGAATRSPFAGMIVAMLIVLLRDDKVRPTAKTAGLLSAGGFAAVTLSGTGRLSFDSVIGAIAGGGGELRPALWSAAWTDFVDHPILGTGAGGFGTHIFRSGTKVLGSDDGAVYPHNLVLELAAELGAVGLVLGAVLLLVGLKTLLRSREPMIVSLLSIGLITALLSGDVTDRRFIYFGLVLAFQIAEYRTAALSEPVASFDAGADVEIDIREVDPGLHDPGPLVAPQHA